MPKMKRGIAALRKKVKQDASLRKKAQQQKLSKSTAMMQASATAAAAAAAKDALSKKPRRPVKPLSFTESQPILFVGEGNFSFCNALASLHGAASNMTATCYDDEATVHAKYADAKDHISSFISLGGTVLYSVDATSLDSYRLLKNKQFAAIFFNFPHVGTGIKDRDRNIRANQILIQTFFSSARPHLIFPNGEIYLTVKTGDPYDDWNIKKLAKSSHLKTRTSFKFLPEIYPGYVHRRTLGFKEGLSAEDNEEIIKSNPRTLVLVEEGMVLDEKEGGKESSRKKKKRTESSSESDGDDDHLEKEEPFDL